MTKAELLDLIASEFPDNSTKLITPGRLRNVVNQMVDDMYPDGFDTHLILKNVRNFSTNPLNDGDGFTVATTLPIGTRFERLWILGSGMTGSPTEPDGSIYLSVGIETDQPICYPNLDIANDSNIAYAGTLPTTAVNRNIVVTAVGGNITGGKLDKLSFLILK